MNKTLLKQRKKNSLLSLIRLRAKHGPKMINWKSKHSISPGCHYTVGICWVE